MKKILAVALAVVILAAMAITVSAYDIDLSPDAVTNPKQNVSLSDVDGQLFINVTGGDPFFGTTNVSLEAAKVAKIVAYIKYVDTEDGFFQMFFTTPNVGWSEPASFKSTIGDWDPDANGFRAMEFYTDESGDWEGTITGLRYDIHNNGEGDAYIDHIDYLAEDGSVVYSAGINAAAAEPAAEEPAAEEPAAAVVAPAAQTADLAVVAIIALGAVAVAKKH